METQTSAPVGSPRFREIANGEYLLCGSPDPEVLARCLDGPGDLWHSGLLRSSGGLLPELKYWRPCGWWYLNDADAAVSGVAWRIEPAAFVVRRSAWECLGGFDRAFLSEAARGLDFGYRLLQCGGVPLHVPGLFPGFAGEAPKTELPREDVYLFFARHFKRDYSLYLLLREAIRRKTPFSEWRSFREAEHRAASVAAPRGQAVPPRPLVSLPTHLPRVSVILPTMNRQQYTADLLEDLALQTLPPHEVFVIDATPKELRRKGEYDDVISRVPLRVIPWESAGACRQRNEAIRLCQGDYIVFADDDTRVLPDYLEKHIRLLNTYRAHASTGVVIAADHCRAGREDLARKFAQHGMIDAVRVESKFGTGCSCVRREWVQKCVGNDVNFEGGYGEDADFGHRLADRGAVVLNNPYSPVLHLKAPMGGFRWWGLQAEDRRRLPWEFRRRAGWIKPRPSPTIVYGLIKHFTPDQVKEWFLVYVLRGWWPRYSKPHESSLKRGLLLGFRILRTPLVLLRIRVARGYAMDLLRRGPLYE